MAGPRSPRKRSLPSSSSSSSPPITDLHRHQLAKVVHSLAPQIVLEQRLTVPDAPETLTACLADDAPPLLLPLSVLRACINEACTSALLSSAMALDGEQQQDSARLLNDVDRFQSAILAVLDQLELQYRSTAEQENGNLNEVKLEGERDDSAPPHQSTKIQRYMLHRTLPSGVDVFTSAAVLSDKDLDALAKIEDTDVIAVHPPPPAFNSTAAVDQVPVPRLGDVNPRPPAAAGGRAYYVPAPVARVGAAPGLYGAEAALRKEPGFLDPINPTRRPTVLLRYPSPFQSSLAPTHDSTGATEPYTASASRALSRLRSQRWLEAALHPHGHDGDEEEQEEGEEQLRDGVELSEAERRTLVDLGVDIEAFLEGINNNNNNHKHESHSAPAPDTDGSRPVAKRRRRLGTAAAAARRSVDSTTVAVWSALERNSELIVSVARAQVARARRSYELELERTRKKVEAAAAAAQRAAVAARPLVGGTGVGAEAGNKVVGEGGGGGERAGDEGALKEDEEGERAGKAELEDAKALLDSLVSLLAALPKPDPGATTSTTTPPLPRVLPPRAFLSQLAPLLLAARQKEPSFHGTLDPLNDRAVKLRENVLPQATAMGAGFGGGGQEMDLRV
ncbi:hypothetical protein C6P46_006797 [Rhodotorula mucilaginosa]|uniref:Uncharacterized protein n=1 Tax=Rhodotorula mucilaginosa TaxID=5537 RepID=A0A9P6W5Q6_RHOMI|nr:hypothetical protein C6P46_006797 [Rhodotorula mucilaginosa]